MALLARFISKDCGSSQVLTQALDHGTPRGRHLLGWVLMANSPRTLEARDRWEQQGRGGLQRQSEDQDGVGVVRKGQTGRRQAFLPSLGL